MFYIIKAQTSAILKTADVYLFFTLAYQIPIYQLKGND